MDMVERVARAICDDDGANWDAKDFCETPWGESPDEMRGHYNCAAIAAIKEMRKPTPEMIKAVSEIAGPQVAAYGAAAWETMIDTELGEHK